MNASLEADGLASGLKEPRDFRGDFRGDLRDLSGG